MRYDFDLVELEKVERENDGCHLQKDVGPETYHYLHHHQDSKPVHCVLFSARNKCAHKASKFGKP